MTGLVYSNYPDRSTGLLPAFVSPPPLHGPTKLEARWWIGQPAPIWAVAGTSALTGIAGGAVCALLPATYALPIFWVFAVVAVPLAFVDVRCQRLPSAMTAGLWASSSIGLTAESLIGGHTHSLLAASVLGIAVSVLALALALVLPGQMGLGDVSLMGVIAFTLGWLKVEAAGVGLAAGVFIQAFIAIVAMVRTGNRQLKLPFGPALLAGWFVAIWFQG